ncbi:23S rRNA (uridine(2552)-2'-O)-methyltransferase RlmE [Suttonella indologenes]|mgnify:CR=1 FL=1|uniref:Ribosomal RNA large subunit methyltransferase E n=1 Tax=Suttonella indologenes TaxID=13276 RepID=A0A380MWJ7_9GAMM|nr:23S rRNA (uridine(2552)-2'-O)-methyltransferase RlmE [Suttonella indologenes]SUO96283.1 Ribosomal RNA large subunit methyltransferase E [Suttonella indologenes]
MARSKSSGNWLKEHHSDPYVLKAREEGYRSRAVYKLKEIQERDKLIRSGMVVVELGAAPGGWSQYVAGLIGSKGRMIALDILPMDSLADVTFIQGDFREEAVLNELLATIGDQAVDLIISDMAPNMSGVKSTDQAKSMYLAELALDFVRQRLAMGGDFLTKVFHGPGFDNYFRELKTDFKTVLTRKPEASRARSQETYLLARGFRGTQIS